MEDVKKEKEEEKVKIYDKEMYISQEKIRTIAIIIIIFIIGFVAGYFSSSFMSTNEVNEEVSSYNENVENS